jgi:hypothetical protein
MIMVFFRKNVIFTLLFFLSVLAPAQLYSTQENTQQPAAVTANNAVFIEFGGIGGHYSVNYDRILLGGDFIKLSGRIGFTPSLIEKDIEFSPRIPIQANALFCFQDHYGVAGIGNTLYWNREQRTRNALFITLGYRYQPRGGGLFVQAEFTPLVFDTGITFFPWGGLGIGICF